MSDDIVVTALTSNNPVDEVTIVIDGQRIAGWEEVEVTLRLEAFPNSFEIAMSALPSAESIAIAGASCQVLIGDDLVISGYIDRDVPGGSASGHTIRLIGRGKTCDLVDCSAEWESGQLINGDAFDIASKLADAYGIAVELGDGAEAGPKVPAVLLNYGETGAEIIQRVARNAGLLAYEDARGRLILGTLGATTTASGVVYGGNVQDWSVENSVDGMFSNYICCSEAMDALQDLPGSDFFDYALDPTVARHRTMYLVLETVADDPQEFTRKKALWEAARRNGRGTAVRATVDSWRDGSGALWGPNMLVPVQLPGLRRAGPLLLSEVTFKRSSETGTVAEMVLMPPPAFLPEPIVLSPVSTADFVNQPAS